MKVGFKCVFADFDVDEQDLDFRNECTVVLTMRCQKTCDRYDQSMQELFYIFVLAFVIAGLDHDLDLQ